MASLNPLTGTLGRRLASHLLRRTIYGPTKAEIDAFAAKTVNQAVNDLLATSGFQMPLEPKDPLTGQGWVFGGPGGTGDYWRQNYMTGWWLNQAFQGSNPHIAQKLTFFYHTLFSVSHRGQRSENHYHQIALFRHYANKSIKDLARKITLDNAMIAFLNSDSNTKFLPNENFAREVLELFTINKGPQIGPGDYTNYTEHDVQQAARLFTGIKQENVYNSQNNQDPDTGIPRGIVFPPHHEPGNKTFSGAFNNTTITGQSTASGIELEFDQFFDMVFNQQATAETYVRKIYRFFIHHELTPEIEQDIITPLANTLKNNAYNILSVLEPLLKSKHFYDMDDSSYGDEIIGGIIKSPLDFFLGVMRFLKVTLPDENANRYHFYHTFWKESVMEFLFVESDMDVWSPPSVAGYNAYHQEPAFSKAWLSANTLPFRYKFIDMLFANQKILIAWSPLHMSLDPVAFVDDAAQFSNPRDAQTLVSELVEYMFPHELDPNRFDYFLDDLLLDNLSAANWAMEWDNFQANGNDANVRPQLEKLIRGVIQAPEYQLM